MKKSAYIDHAVHHGIPSSHIVVVEEGVVQHLVDVPTHVLQSHSTEQQHKYVYDIWYKKNPRNMFTKSTNFLRSAITTSFQSFV